MGDVHLYHPGLDQSIIVDEQAASHHALSGWVNKGKAIRIPVKNRPAQLVTPRMVRIYNPQLGVGQVAPEQALSHFRRAGWVLEAEWFGQQSQRDAQAAREEQARAEAHRAESAVITRPGTAPVDLGIQGKQV